MVVADKIESVILHNISFITNRTTLSIYPWEYEKSEVTFPMKGVLCSSSVAGFVQNVWQALFQHASLQTKQFHSPPKGGALDARLDSVLVLSPWFSHKIGFSFLQSSPLCRLLLLGELPSHLLTNHLLQDKQTNQQKSTVTFGRLCVSAMAHCNQTKIPLTLNCSKQ